MHRAIQIRATIDRVPPWALALTLASATVGIRLEESEELSIETAMQIAGQRLGYAPLGEALRGQGFERAAHVDGVADLVGRESAHHVAAGLVLDQQAFLREQWQCLAHRGARHAEQIRERRLGHALGGRELAVQDHFAQPNHRFGHLGAHGAHVGSVGSHPSRRDPVLLSTMREMEWVKWNGPDRIS